MDYIRVVHHQRRPWKAYLALILCLVSGPWIFYEWNRQWTRVPPGADGWAPNAAVAAQAESPMQALVAGKPITDVLAIHYAQDKKALAGKPVQLDTVGVRAMSGPDAFWVSQLGTQPIFVALGDKAAGAKVRAGEAVNLTGTVQIPPGRGQARARWPQLTDDQLAQLESDAVYVQADSVEVTGRY